MFEDCGRIWEANFVKNSKVKYEVLEPTFQSIEEAPTVYALRRLGTVLETSTERLLRCSHSSYAGDVWWVGRVV